jgi:hypothetical protein
MSVVKPKSRNVGSWRIAALGLVERNIRLLTKAEIGEPRPGTLL